MGPYAHSAIPGRGPRGQEVIELDTPIGPVSRDPVDVNLADAEQVLAADLLFRELVVQRSRAYVKESQLKQGAALASFPTRADPQVAVYSVKKTYGKLLDMIEAAFAKENPLFSLALYYPLRYYSGTDHTINPFAENRQKQVVGLIRIQFLKRFESSAHAFERSCERLLEKLLAFAVKHSETASEKTHLERWKSRNAGLIGYVHEHQLELGGSPDEDSDEDIVTEEMLEAVEYLSREEYNVAEILNETRDDLEQIALFINELRKFQPKHDDKLKALFKLLNKDPVLSQHKVLIFTEFANTAHYLRRQLAGQGIDNIDRVDSATKDRFAVIRRFAPYYNDSTSSELAAEGIQETRVLISTDVLSEGLNLQDATRLINYDLHWNPVRLMQRIGRVDRRLNPEMEAKLLADHPEQAPLRGQVAYWNFLPPDELDELLRLYGTVSRKTLRISKTFGIEGRKLLRPEDDLEALKNFNHQYEGTTTPVEALHLEYQQLLKDHPDLAERLNALPGRVFSGKQLSPLLMGAPRGTGPGVGGRAVFFCFALPAADHGAPALANGERPWTEEAGRTAWYLYDLETQNLLEEPAAIVASIRCLPDTPRHCSIGKETLADIRGKIEKHVKNTYLKSVQAPVGVKPVLKTWLELS